MRSYARRRLYHLVPRSPLDGWCQRGLMVLAISGGSACALFFTKQSDWPLGLAVFLPFFLLFAPFATRWINFFSLEEKHHELINQSFYLVMILSFPFLTPSATAASWGVALLLCLHGYAMRYARFDNFAALALILSTAELLLAHHVLWPGDLLARAIVSTWMLSSLLLAGGIATWLHARWSRRRLLRHERSHLNPPEDGAGLWARARFMMIMGLMLFPLGLILQQTTSWMVPKEKAVSSDSFVASDNANSDTGEENSNRDLAEIDHEPPRDFIFPTEIPWQGRVTQSTKDVWLFQLRSDRDINRTRPYFSAARPLYLAATTFDTLSEKGLSRGFAPEAIFHANSGLGSDDWVIFNPDFRKDAVIQFKMKTRPLLHQQNGGKGRLSFLLHDRTMVALRYPSCRLDENDHTALAEVPKSAMFEYQWLSHPVNKNVPLVSVRRAPPRYLTLPKEAEFRPWVQAALDLCQEKPSQQAKLDRILNHFHQDYVYDLEPSAKNGIQAFSDFFEQKRGYCSYFASAAMLYLRANGIACRVATGFMVTEYSTQHQAYLGRLPGHAWVEVLQNDGTWRTLEPTPSGSRMDAIAALRARQDTEAFPEDPAPPVALEIPAAVEETEQPSQSLNSNSASLNLVMTSIGAILGIVVLAVTIGNLASVLMQRKKQHAKEAMFSTEAILAMDYWARVRSHLEILGFHKKRSESASEFARSVQRWGGEFYLPLSTITRLVYRTRFGGHIWSGREWDFLDRFEDLLIRKANDTRD
ncbi:MAG: transglutaminase domain-containing protein [Planctomycetota bacterium]